MKKIIFLVLFLSTLYCYPEDLWKPSSGIISPAGIGNITVSADNVLYVASEQHLFRSIDGGNNWTPIYLEKQNLIEHFFSGGDLKCDKNGDLYILTREAFYKLANNSDTAKIILNFEYSTRNNLSIFLSEDSKKVVVFDDKEIWVSNDFGVTWKQINLGSLESYGLHLSSITYDENYGIIKNYSSGSYPGEYFVYYSTDDGLIWHQLKTLPGTNIPANNIHVFDSNLWVNGSDVYNFNTKKLTPFNVEKPQKYFKNSKGYYIVSFSEIFFSGDEGETWNDITNDVFKGDGLGWIDAIYIGNTDVLYAGTRYKRLKKSSDNGNTWERIIFNTSKDMQFSGVKKAGKNVYATDNTNSIFVSEDSCKSWKQIPLYKNYYFTDHFDVNNKGEIVYNDGPLIYYSSDMGVNWKILDTTGYNRIPRSMLKIFENSVIVCRQDSYSSTFMYKSANQKGVWLNQVSAMDLYLLKDGNYLNFSWGFIQLIDKDFTTSEFITSSLSDHNGFHPSFNNFCISKDGVMYLTTERGIYKSTSVSDNFSLIAFKDSNVKQIFIDDNNYLYISIGQRILFSKDDGITWTQINSNLGFTNIQFFFAFGDARLLVRSDQLYYADLKNAAFPEVLNLNLTSQESFVFYNSPVEINYSVSDGSGNPVESAAIVIYNSLTCKTDTIYSDINGKAVYSLKMDYYNQNRSKEFQLYSYSNKNGYLQSNINPKKFTYLSRNNELFCTSDNYSVAKPDSSVSISIGLGKYVNGIFQNAVGTLIIKNEFTGNEQTITYNSGIYTYNINIPQDAERGMFRISIKGKNSNNDTTLENIMYLVVIDSIPEGDIWVSVINESSDRKNILVYPNPATDYITIQPSEGWKPSEGYDVQIIDMLGTVVASIHPMTGSHRMNIEYLSPGIYFIKIGNRVEKFVKM